MSSKQDSDSDINSIINIIIRNKHTPILVFYFIQSLVIALKTSDQHSALSNDELKSLVKRKFLEKGEELNDNDNVITQLDDWLVKFDNGEMSIIVPTSGGERKRRKKTRRKIKKRIKRKTKKRRKKRRKRKTKKK